MNQQTMNNVAGKTTQLSEQEISNQLDSIHKTLGMGKYDPIMAELWQIKAKMNKDANYEVRKLGYYNAPTSAVQNASQVH